MQYSKLVEVYLKLENTSKRLEKTWIISKFLQDVPKEDLKSVVYLLQGKVFPHWDERKLGMSSRLLVKAIANASGNSTEKIEKMWSRLGDLGLVAEELMEDKKQKTLFSTKLTVKKIVENICKLTEMEGEGTVNRKVSLIAELLGNSDKEEAKFIIRTVLEELRTGVGDSTIRDSLVWSFYPKVIGIFFKCEKCKEINPASEKCLNCGGELEPIESSSILEINNLKDLKNIDNYKFINAGSLDREVYNKFIEEVQNAFDVTTDFGLIAEKLKEKGVKGLENIDLVTGKPIKVMLYQKVKDIKEGFEVVGKPAMIEPKIDGFRMQIHRNREEIKLFTRRLEDVTKQFPDVEKEIRTNIRSKDFIVDCEILGIDSKTKRAIPFQNISQRIKRKYDIERLVKEIPVVINIFDVVELNGENLLNEKFENRRRKLKAIIKEEKYKIELIEQLITSDEKKAEAYYKDCLAKGHEGVMMKNMQGIYKPGKRVGYGVKVKPIMESLDLVITQGEWGEGKRAKWLSSFTLACKEEDRLLEIGKVGTGIKEKAEEGVSFEELTEELKDLIMEEKGKNVIVKPKLVVEVVFEEIQKSPSYSSGYALRFPRVIRLRYDKGVKDISTLKEVEAFYKGQK